MLNRLRSRSSERHHIEAIIRSALCDRGYDADGGVGARAHLDSTVRRLLAVLCPTEGDEPYPSESKVCTAADTLKINSADRSQRKRPRTQVRLARFSLPLSTFIDVFA